jgi:hypothetical protein
MEYNLESLPSSDIQYITLELAKSNNHSVIITLTNGEQLFGDLFPEFRFFDKTPDEEEWGLVEKDGDMNIYVKLLPKMLLFNTKEGQKYGDSFFIELKHDFISDIRNLNWENLEEVRWMPNPFATMICEHNFTVAENCGFKIRNYLEASLSEMNIPPEGILFTREQLIYADWEFLSQISGGTSGSVGISVINLKPGRTLFNLALDKMRNGKVEKIRNFLPGSYPLEEGKFSGFLVLPSDDIHTIVEGEECVVALCCKETFFSPQNKYMPIILKKNSLRYPIEYLRHLRSELVFYGEVVEIPIYEQEISSDASIMIRGIAYLNK